MKRLFLTLLVLPVLICVGRAYAAEPSDTSETKPSQESTADLAKQKEQRKKIEAKRAELEATQWQVSLVSRDPKSKPEADTLIFQSGQFKTENRFKRGFNSTNYTVSMPEGDEGPAVFETMQTGKEGNVFVKGSWKKDSMEGEIMEQLEGAKTTKEYSFSNAKKSIIPASENKDDVASSPGTEARVDQTAMVSLEKK